MTELLLSIPEAARRLGVSERRVRSLCDEGKLAAVKVGKFWIIREADLTAWQPQPRGWPKGRPRGSHSG